MLKVAALIARTKEQQSYLLEAHPDVEFCFGVELNEENIGQFDCILGNPKPGLLKHAKQLKMIQLWSAGVDGYTDPGIYGSQNVILCNASGAYGLAISECLVSMHLCIQKHLHLYRDNMHANLWRDQGMVKSIMDSTVLVVGTGDIGNEYAKRVKDMGAKVIGVRRTMKPMPELYDEMYTTEQLDEALPKADCVALCLPGTEKTKGIMGEKQLRLMKKGAILLNIGRGTAIDQVALKAVLDDNHLLGAAIDVTDPEPLPADSPLWGCKNLLITPHVTGGGHLQATTDTILQIATSNLGYVKRGELPPRVVNLQEGY